MKAVVICGSQRYKDEIRKFVDDLKKLGAPIVFEPNFERRKLGFAQKDERERLQSKAYRAHVPAAVHAHFERIRKADICYIYNKDGYLGINTTLEIGYAHHKKKKIYFLNPVPEQKYIIDEILTVEPIVLNGDFSKII